MVNANRERALRMRHNEKAPGVCDRAWRSAHQLDALAARAGFAPASVAGFSALARDLALLGRIHRREAPFRTTALRCCHVLSPG